MRRSVVALGAALALGACVSSPTPEGETIELSEEVLAIVGPNQDVSRARLEVDGCYWWLYRGPVESTYLPLVTAEGRMICVREPT